MSDDTLAGRVRRAQESVAAFRDAMRAQGLHVGLGIAGGAVRCVTCDEPWPCSNATHEQRSRT